MSFIKFSNITPNAAEVDHDSVISCWLEVEEYFRSNDVRFNRETSVSLLIDSIQVREKLDWLKPENCEDFFKRYFSNKEDLDLEKEHPFSASLKVNILKEPNDSSWNKSTFLRCFIEQLFLVMNICTRGGCNYGRFSIDIDSKEHSLHCDTIESGWHRASIDNWPSLRSIPFANAWGWMERNGGLSYLLAETPINKAFAVLLHMSYKSELEATDVVQLSQVLESFYLSKREPKVGGLSRKIPAALGSFPENEESWIKDFYKLRSDIVHGDFPIFRPRYDEEDSGFKFVEDRYWEVSREIDRGVSIVITTLQDLINKKSDYYLFKEEITVETDRYS
ncbi:hypothetical protein [Pleionea sp. CnH1-48]|uniref:hypothetical protein n=1 Tax=Pleionea sp. CnH1-48 TaxID=2954494 RepID=UPI002096F57E|nr:hypothetical protein [Pleionea sp. CnH1-48]MCO7222726.1 hypothetical protein [Pleionea sp. CnH1-48]